MCLINDATYQEGNMCLINNIRLINDICLQPDSRYKNGEVQHDLQLTNEKAVTAVTAVCTCGGNVGSAQVRS